MAAAVGSRVLPGERVGLSERLVAGRGTYVNGSHVYASVVGLVELAASTTDGETRQTVQVLRSGQQTEVPKPGDIVTVKVTKINPRQAGCDILCVGPHALESSFQGVIRQQDVRATEIDKVLIVESFRPGDVVRAEVLSLGDARSYYLTTARNELGVIYANSLAGHPMIAVDWGEMQCPTTLAREKRKVANTRDVTV